MMRDKQLTDLAIAIDVLGQIRSRGDVEGQLVSTLIALYVVALRAHLTLDETIERLRRTFDTFEKAPSLIPPTPAPKTKGTPS